MNKEMLKLRYELFVPLAETTLEMSLLMPMIAHFVLIAFMLTWNKIDGHPPFNVVEWGMIILNLISLAGYSIRYFATCARHMTMEKV